MSKKKSIKSDIQNTLGKGLVTKNTGSSYNVLLDTGNEINCRIKGNFRIKGIRTTNPVAVGDRVTVSKAADDADYITDIEPRRNYIIRRASNLSKESHILASNLDIAILVATLRDPVTPTTFIDRFLATAEAYSVPAALLLNKDDMWDDLDTELADALTNLYSSLGYKVFHTSAKTDDGIPELIDYITGKTTLLAGNSGVGKSSLVNALVPGVSLKTGQISDIHHTGMHTTTFSEMIPLNQGGFIIDIPGVRGFGTIDFEPEEVGHFFPEIFNYSRNCRYSDCKHVSEPGCAVVPAVEEHFIAESRYASYLSILQESEEKEGADKYRKPF